MSGHIAMPKFVDINFPSKKNANTGDKKESFFSKFFGNKK